MINFADPANLVVEEDQPKIEQGPEGETSLQLMQNVYRDRKLPLTVRVRCAVEAAPYENPRVSAVAVTSMSGQSFAEALERAISRSQGPLLLNGSVEELPAIELKKPFVRSSYRRY
jgi:hypothetical protein